MVVGNARRTKQTLGQGQDQAAFRPLRLLGDRLCLDFANTIESPLGERPHDFLTGYADLARWGHHAALLTDVETARLLAEAQRRPDDAATTFGRALELRGAIYRLFRAVARDEAPTAPDVAVLEREHRSAMAHARLTPHGTGFRWCWDEGDDLDRMLWPVVRSAVELLTEEAPERVKECPGTGDCGWLFYDTSKNGTRRWCSMEGCGSRAKMRRQYARQRSAKRGAVAQAPA